MFQLTLWSIPPLMAALVTVSAYLHVRNLKEVPGASAFRLLLAAVLLWCGAEFLDSIITNFEAKALVAQIKLCAIVVTPVAWFAFALTFANGRAKAPNAALNVVSIIPLISIGMIVTNQWHLSVWSDIWLANANDYITLLSTHGPWFYVHAGYSYLLIFIASTVLTFSLYQSGQSWRPISAVVLAPLVIAAGNIYSVSPFNATPWFDLSSLSFAIAMLLMDKGLLRTGLLESHPVIRDRVVEQLREGVVVIKPNGTIIDINSAALQILNAQREDIPSKPITDYVQSVPLTNLNSRQRNNVELTLNQRAYDVTSSKLDPTSKDSDVVFVFRDVTERREAQARLQQLKIELEEMAHTDALTGLQNRRLFITRLNEEAERVRRHGSTLSVLIFDLDHFKQINDTYGHDAGDEVLKSVSAVAMDVKRITDVAARVGGEEFAILLPETDAIGALHLASRLREGIEKSKTLASDGHRIQVTASVGVATVTRESQDIENILKFADNALYKAKHAGRNQVCAADIR
jgi:diguanylate cyclase (GGDEF)-like protein